MRKNEWMKQNFLKVREVYHCFRSNLRKIMTERIGYESREDCLRKYLKEWWTSLPSVETLLYEVFGYHLWMLADRKLLSQFLEWQSWRFVGVMQEDGLQFSWIYKDFPDRKARNRYRANYILYPHSSIE